MKVEKVVIFPCLVMILNIKIVFIIITVHILGNAYLLFMFSY